MLCMWYVVYAPFSGLVRSWCRVACRTWNTTTDVIHELCAFSYESSDEGCEAQMTTAFFNVFCGAGITASSKGSKGPPQKQHLLCA